MANRYWVGGTNTWNGTAGTKWATTSGGAGGAAVPTSADDVFFDEASGSGAVTVTLATGNTGAKSINFTGFEDTFAGSAAITVSGSITLSSTMTRSYTGIITINGTGSITFAGKSLANLTINGTGITVTLNDAMSLTSSATLTVTAGTINTNGYSVTLGNILSTGTTTRGITLGGSVVTLLGSSFNLTSTGMTFSSGTSTISMTSNGGTFTGAGLTYSTVALGGVNPNSAYSIVGANTYTNLTLRAPNTYGLTDFLVGANQTVTGVFSCTSSSATRRTYVSSDVRATARTITAATLTATDVDFEDITLAGAAAGSSPTRAGNCGGNSGITFPAAKTVYRINTVSSFFETDSWSSSSGGTADAALIPLVQDTAIVDNNSGTVNIELDYWRIPTIDCSAKTTGSNTLSNLNGADLYGNLILPVNAVTISGAVSLNFIGRVNQTFTTNGNSIVGQNLVINSYGGVVSLGSALTTNTASNGITLTRGVFNSQSYNVSVPRFSSSNVNPRSVTMGSSVWTLTGTGTVWDMTTSSSSSVIGGTAEILLSNTTTTARTFSGGGITTYPKLTIGGATGVSVLTISGTCGFTELASTKTVAHTIRFSAVSSFGPIGTWSVKGTAGNLVTVDSSTAGTRRTFALTNVTSGIDYLSVKDIGITSVNRFYVGVNSTDGGNNSNVYFTAAPSLGGSTNFLMMF